MKKDKPDWAKIALGAQLLILALAALAIVRGAVLSTLWGWFIVPLGVPDINLGEAIGISLIAGFLMPQRPAEKKENAAAEAFWLGILIAAFALAAGWIVHLFL